MTDHHDREAALARAERHLRFVLPDDPAARAEVWSWLRDQLAFDAVDLAELERRLDLAPPSSEAAATPPPPPPTSPSSATQPLRVKLGRSPYTQRFTCSHCRTEFELGGLFLRVEQRGILVDFQICGGCTDTYHLFETMVTFDRHEANHPISLA